MVLGLRDPGHLMLIRKPHITPPEFQEILGRFDRVAVTGVVKGGKSLLLENTDPKRRVFHTDELHRKGLEFKDYPGHVLEALGGVQRFVVAGMQVPRVLRKGLEVDALVWVNTSRESLTAKQSGFSKGARTIMHKWRRENPEVPVYFIGRALHEAEVAS